MQREHRRIALDSLTQATSGLRSVSPPVHGWLRAVRQAMGLSRSQLAQKLKVSGGAVRDYEMADSNERITISTLKRVARSLDCDLVLALVPRHNRSFLQLADQMDPDKRHDRATEHSMKLEGQGSSQPNERMGELATLPSIRNVEDTLRSADGRFDADRIRALFDLPGGDFAALLGVSATTMRRLPDAKEFQQQLRSFAHIAWLLALENDKAKFARWLRTKNPELDDRTPLELIKSQRVHVVGALVEDIVVNRGR